MRALNLMAKSGNLQVGLQVKSCQGEYAKLNRMGYALWIDGDLAWAEGAHEYRAWGTAVVSARTGFRLRDFRRRVGKRERRGEPFVGLFPSLEELNYYLRTRQRRGGGRTKLQRYPAFLG